MKRNKSQYVPQGNLQSGLRLRPGTVSQRKPPSIDTSFDLKPQLVGVEIQRLILNNPRLWNPSRKADLGDAGDHHGQQRLSPLNPLLDEVLVWRLIERRRGKQADEVIAREAGRASNLLKRRLSLALVNQSTSAKIRR